MAEECQIHKFDLSSIKSGHIASIEHMGHTIRVYHRTDENINELYRGSHTTLPDSIEPTNTASSSWPQTLPGTKAPWASKKLRSLTQKYFVYWDGSPHNDCDLGLLHFPPKSHQHLAESKPDYFEFLGDDWPGGFFDACYGAAYDYAGVPIYRASYELEDNITQLRLEERSKYSLLIPEYTVQENKLYLKTCKPNKLSQPTANVSSE